MIRHMGDVEIFDPKRRNSQEPRFAIEDRVYIKRNKLAKYVRAVEGVDPSAIEAWRERREAARAEGKIQEDDFLDHVAHPKVEFVMSTSLGIIEKVPGRFKLARGPSVPAPYVWVDAVDVDGVLMNPKGLLEPIGLENRQSPSAEERISESWGRSPDTLPKTTLLNSLIGPVETGENGQGPPPVTPEREDK